MDNNKTRVLVVGIPSRRGLFALEQLEARMKGMLEIDFKPLEEHIAAMGRSVRDKMVIIDEIDKPTKHEVGTYAAMFGVPAKTYTPPHKAKRKGKRK
ncbi:hypothetical protein [Salmonella phage SE4]|uniref:hypothetical protein n=1 Tax=Salmonella phage SE4 TaxID=2575328 RepID=UPI0011D2D92A|nr:hypothetical protein HWC20_gp11 [Salmonella phage SE4]QEG07737.1 hypothetical protein [Salmonella phage SE4]